MYCSLIISQGTSKTKAKFVLGMYGLSMPYYVHITHEPKYDTVTWTLDYSRLSTLGKDCVVYCRRTNDVYR